MVIMSFTRDIVNMRSQSKIWLLFALLNNRLIKIDNCSKIKAKRTTKDSVFTDLFKDKKNLLKMNRVLHPEYTKSTEEKLEVVLGNPLLCNNDVTHDVDNVCV
jgi:hypothetical protein